MDAKKLIDNLFTAISVADAVRSSPGALVNADVALSAFFSRRFSDEDGYKATLDYLVYLSRDTISELSDRETVFFPSGQNRLAGYLYRAEGIARGLILYVHGIRGCADDKYAIPQAEFLRRGYDVFAIDLTASGRSGGHGLSGLQQSAYDVAAAAKYVSTRVDLSGLPLYFFGHSWGAYGVAASLGLGARPRGVVAVSGFDSPLKEMMGLPSAKLGADLSFGEKDLRDALERRVGENYDLSASASILSSGVNALAIHGANDVTVPLKGVSTYDHLPSSYRKLIPHAGHMDIFYDPMARQYARRVMDMGQEMVASYGKKLSDVPEDVVQDFRSRFDRRLCSALDKDLFDAIDAFYASC